MRWVMVASLVLILGCPSNVLPPSGGIACTALFAYGINLTIRDTAGNPVTGATVTLTDGQYSETMMELGPGEYVGAGERAGTYSMLIEADGFVSKTVAGIEIDEDECHVIPVALVVGLTAAG